MVLSMKMFKEKRQAASAFSLGLFLFLQALVICPGLHELVHHDANEPDHDCAVTLFSHGHVDAASAVVILLPAPERVIFNPSSPAAIFVSTDLRLLPGRGPPASPALA